MTHIKASLFFSRRCLHSFFSIHLELLLRLHPYYGIPVLSLFLKTASSQFQEREIENEIGFEWLNLWVYMMLFHSCFLSLCFKTVYPLDWGPSGAFCSILCRMHPKKEQGQALTSSQCQWIPAMGPQVYCLARVCKQEFVKNEADLITSTWAS